MKPSTTPTTRATAAAAQVQRTRWYPASGHVDLSFQDVLIAASRSVQEAKLNALQPWGLETLCAYEPGYLAGFKAQRYQVELADGYNEAKDVMASRDTGRFAARHRWG